MNVIRIAAFSQNNKGGNPAGVVIADLFPSKQEMQQTAKQVGYSETAFLERRDDGWGIRYFSPDIEVPFCGHATIASGYVLGQQFGAGIYKLYLNAGDISVEVSEAPNGAYHIALQSPQTWSEHAPREYVDAILQCFNFSNSDIDSKYPPRFSFAGAKHLILALKSRTTLANMSYDFESLRALMQNADLITVNLVVIESNETIHARNPFPPGGVYEDPATGAAAAALGGYLRDIGWQGSHKIEVLQGQDMGVPSRLVIEFTNIAGDSIKVSGEARYILPEPD